MVSSTLQMMIILLWYLCATALYSSMSHGNLDVRCNVKDRETLEIFKGSIEDPWKLLSSWSGGDDCCNWLGVHCDNLTGRVTELDLHCPRNSTFHKCLSGQINLSVLKLEFLSYLDLHANNFNAILIPSLQSNYASSQRSVNMSMTTDLHQGMNFSNIVFLDLSYNSQLRIDDLSWVSHLSSLNYLDLSYVDLSKEILWLQRVAMLPSLLQLRLSRCFLNTTQPSLGYVNFSSLEELDISDNHFRPEVPKWLFNLSSSISRLDLSFNYFRGQVPQEFSNFWLLKFLLLKSNNFNGSIPEWVGQYNQLEHLDLSSNSFSGPIPETLGNLSSLAYLDVRHNQLNGSLPKSLGQLPKLRSFFAGYNLLSGNISLFLCQRVSGKKKLMVLEMTRNYLSRELPDCWIYWKKHLRIIILRSNNFSGSIPPQICQVSNLQVLDLSGNNLSGSIPKCFGNITAMASIPTFAASKLLFKNYYYNGRGVDPSSIRNYVGYLPIHFRNEEYEYWGNYLRFIHLIDLSNNNISGSIPPELHSLVALHFLNLSRNYLMESIPDGIGHMENLESLDLSWNQLAGRIPQSLTELSLLSSLDLAYNNFSGRIPLANQFLTFDASTYMGNPQLCGIPLAADCSSRAQSPIQFEIPNEKTHIIGSSGDEFTKCFYFGMAIGSAYGFWGVCFALFFVRTWRLAYFQFLNNMYDQIYIFIALKTKWLR